MNQYKARVLVSLRPGGSYATTVLTEAETAAQAASLAIRQARREARFETGQPAVGAKILSLLPRIPAERRSAGVNLKEGKNHDKREY